MPRTLWYFLISSSSRANTWLAVSCLAFTLYGISGVDLFFVLSGFIMVAVAGRDIGPIEFLWRRATRIYPTYWLSFSSGTRRRDCSAHYCKLVDPSSDLAVAIILAYS